MDREVSDILLEFINTASSLKILDIRSFGSNPLNFEIQIVYPSEFVGSDRQEDTDELNPPISGSIKVVDLDEEGLVLHEVPFARTEEAGRLNIFHNNLQLEGYRQALQA